MQGFRGIIIILNIFFLPTWGYSRIILFAPNAQIRYEFNLVSGAPVYSVIYKTRTIIQDAAISIDFQESGLFKKNLSLLQPIYKNSSEQYELTIGKTKLVKDTFHEVIIPLEEKTVPFRKINLVVRAFNDGLAFRYEFPLQRNWLTFNLREEHTTFNFLEDPMVLALFLPHYTTSHEGEYTSISLSKIKNESLMDMPVLFELSGPVYVGITEASLHNYAGMYLTKKNGILTSTLSPLPHQSALKVKATLPHRSPWRVMLISDRIGALIESNVITSLNDPLAIQDISWIKPGKSTWPWWNGNIVPDSINAPGNNFVTNQYYIDFCARNQIEYHSVVEYGLHQWYMDDGVNFQPGPHADVTQPVPGLDMKAVCDYAHTQGVDVRVWVHWRALYPQLDSALATFSRWGLSGMMVDFMDRDDQEMVNIQEEILQKASKHHLHIQFHGAYKPTGMHRTYPNEYTREGTLNYEANKWGSRMTPDHDINIPFTRMLAGATDYHLGGFRTVPDSAYRAHYTRPMMMGTRCHMMAMYIVLESYLALVCDYPEAYEGQPGFEFISHVPTTWDETKVLDAKLHEYIVIARRKEKDWYIGAINNKTGRTIHLPTNFLDKGHYEMNLFTDAEDISIQPNHIQETNLNLQVGKTISMYLAAGGGAVMKIKRTD